jgi:hypothetical protein
MHHFVHRVDAHTWEKKMKKDKSLTKMEIHGGTLYGQRFLLSCKGMLQKRK